LHQYRTTETGDLMIKSFIPFVVALPIVAYWLKKVDLRIPLALGFFIIALCNFHDSHALSTWHGVDFVPGQLFGSVGICLATMATVCGVIFEGKESGAYRVRAGAYAQGAYFQAVRLFGQESTARGLQRFILYRTHYWQTKLAAGLPTFGQFDPRIMHLSIPLAPQASGIPDAHSIATGLTFVNLQREAFTLATNDSFMMLAWICAISLLAIAFLRRIPLPHELPAADEPPGKPDPNIGGKPALAGGHGTATS
jgi:hypothetical protein